MVRPGGITRVIVRLRSSGLRITHVIVVVIRVELSYPRPVRNVCYDASVVEDNRRIRKSHSTEETGRYVIERHECV